MPWMCKPYAIWIVDAALVPSRCYPTSNGGNLDKFAGSQVAGSVLVRVGSGRDKPLSRFELDRVQYSNFRLTQAPSAFRRKLAYRRRQLVVG